MNLFPKKNLYLESLTFAICISFITSCNPTAQFRGSGSGVSTKNQKNEEVTPPNTNTQDGKPAPGENDKLGVVTPIQPPVEPPPVEPPPVEPPPVEPPPVEPPPVVPPPEPTPNVICTSSHKAMRIVFVVDNSSSHTGADPASFANNCLVNNGASCTLRQNALWKAISFTREKDIKAKEINPTFLGSDIGLLYFPKDNTLMGTNQFVFTSGSSNRALPNTMTNLLTTQSNNNFDASLWESLNFTHKPEGTTPYRTAIEGAKVMLEETRIPGDKREEIIIILGDGVPTDARPKIIPDFVNAELKSKGIKILSLLVFEGKLGEGDDAYDSLKSVFRKPGYNYGADFKEPETFEDYWNFLVNLPAKISNELYSVNSMVALEGKLKEIIDFQQHCKEVP